MTTSASIVPYELPCDKGTQENRPGRVARHRATLAALISGIVASTSTQLPKVAAHVPTGTQPESRVKRFDRWLRHDQVTAEV